MKDVNSMNEYAQDSSVNKSLSNNRSCPIDLNIDVSRKQFLFILQ